MKKSFRSILLSYLALFTIGCASVGNNFDESKIQQIKKGETTESELVEWFGQPQNRTINAEAVTTLTWMYVESKMKGESFIPYAGAFMGGNRSKTKTLNVQLADNKVTGYTYSGGGMESRGTAQSDPK